MQHLLFAYKFVKKEERIEVALKISSISKFDSIFQSTFFSFLKSRWFDSVCSANKGFHSDGDTA